jgi:predicted O-methyltransferase YrrM
MYQEINKFFQDIYGNLAAFEETQTYAEMRSNVAFAKCIFSANPKVMWPIETQVLAHLIAHRKPENIFEIGTYDGLTTLHFAYNSPKESIIYTLDLPPDTDVTALSKQYSYDDLQAVKLSVETSNKRKFKNDPTITNIVELFGDSMRFDFSPYYGMIDFMFIDGNHSYEFVKSDTENAFRMLSSNGVIVWHDYDYICHKDTFNYLNSLTREHGYKIYFIQGTRFAVYGLS